MDLYAYSQISKCKKYLEENNIDVPRLRGLRLMKEQKLLSYEDIEKEIKLWYIWAVYPKAKSINDLHGKKRKKYKLLLKQAKKQYDIYNKYVGKNVLYVHARLGGSNWSYCGGSELEKHPLYLERVDDYLDNTYCDIYFKLKEDK